MKRLILTLMVIATSATTFALPRVAVVDFDAQQHGGKLLGAQLADYVTDELVNTGLFDVVEREKLRSIMREQGLSGSGMIDPASATQMGRLLGASYLLTGRVISIDEEKRSFDGYGIKSQMVVYTMAVSVRMFDTEKGTIVFSSREKATDTVRASGGLRVQQSNAYAKLVEGVAVALIERLEESPRFARAQQAGTTALATVSVHFSSTPADADVEIHNVFYGNAGEPMDVPSGLHLVRISLSGYQPWEKKVMLKQGMKINAKLAPAQE